jgi:hypothetical protein
MTMSNGRLSERKRLGTSRIGSASTQLAAISAFRYRRPIKGIAANAAIGCSMHGLTVVASL